MASLALHTSRLTLLAATADLLELELQGHAAFAKALSAQIPSGWPPPLYERSHMQWTLAELKRDPTLCTWLTWFWLSKTEPQPILIGFGGFKGKPDQYGSVEIGYNVLSDFQRQGFATEAVNALVAWALSHSNVTSVFAETLPELPASIRVLKKCGFEFLGNGSDIEVLRFQRKRGST